MAKEEVPSKTFLGMFREYFPKGLSTACAGSDRGRALGIPPESKIPGIAAIPTCAFPGLAGRNQIAPNQEFRREFGI